MALIDNVQMHANKEYTFTRVQIHGYINVQMHSRQGPHALEAAPCVSLRIPSSLQRPQDFFLLAPTPAGSILMRLALRSFAASEAGVLSGILTRKASN